MTEQLQIDSFPCLNDNYGFLLHAAAAGLTAVVDTPEVAPIEAALKRHRWRLTHILNTHHHGDHVGGNQQLKQRHGCTIVGPKADAYRIPGIDRALTDGERFDFGGHIADIYATPGHTRGHIVYHFPTAKAAFVGDTLFALGCGRLFEGTPQQMWASLRTIRDWPDATRIYCAHEYTQANARFALRVEPNNQELIARCQHIDALRAAAQPTIPTTLAIEKRTNPFLRADTQALVTAVGMQGATAVDVFTHIRLLKDRF